MRIRYVVDVDYDEATVASEKVLRAEVENNIESQIGNGLLSDNWGEVIIDRYNIKSGVIK